MKYYVYQRVSTDAQSVSQQKNIIDKYCLDHGIRQYETVSDEGVSGKVSYRDRSLMGLLDRMEPGDCLIVSEISRLGRSMSDLSRLVNDEMKPRKLRLVVISMNIDLDCQRMRAVDELLLTNFAFAAQLERELIAERVTSKMEVIKSNIESGGHVVEKGKRKGQVIHKLGNPMLSNGTFSSIAGKASGKARSAKAKSNPHNAEFARLLTMREECKGAPLEHKDAEEFSDMLNKCGAKTSTGLDFTPQRAWAMLLSMRRQGIV